MGMVVLIGIDQVFMALIGEGLPIEGNTLNPLMEGVYLLAITELPIN